MMSVESGRVFPQSLFGNFSVYAGKRSAPITIAGPYLLCYALGASRREDSRRGSNGDQATRVTALATKRGKVINFTGYWRRHSAEQCRLSCSLPTPALSTS